MSDRRTLGPSTAHNRQSTVSFGRQSCAGKRPVRSGKDPRDLHNKSMQKETKQKVITFLAKHHYPAEISLKTLMNQKEFFAVVWFMIGVLMPCHPQSERTIDALIHHLRVLEYPYAPPKSTLQSCSSPLFLPAMLGLLEWLLDYCIMATVTKKEKMKGSMSGQEDRLDSRKRNTERAVRFHTGFMRYLQGDDDEGNHVVQLVEESNELTVQHADKERERQRRVIAELDSCRDELQQQPDLVAGKLRDLESLRQRQRTTGEAISSSTVEVKSWHQQAADVERNERKLQLDMEETEREQLVVKKRITHQPMDVKQATRVRDNLRREKREAERKQQLLEEHQKEITALKDEAYDRLGAIDTLCNRLNNGLHILKMCPKDAKYAKKQDLAIQVPRNMKEEACEKQLDTVLTSGVKNSRPPRVLRVLKRASAQRELGPALEARLKHFQRFTAQHTNETHNKEKQTPQILTDADKIESEVANLHTAIEAEKTAVEDVHTMHQQEVQQKDARVLAQDVQADDFIPAAESKAEELQTDCDGLKSQLDDKTALAQADIKRVLAENEKDKQHTQEALQKVTNARHTALQSLDESYEMGVYTARSI